MTPPDRLRTLRSDLEKRDQAHLLAFADALAPDRLARLLDQIESVDFDALDRRLAATADAADALPDDLAPAPYVPRDPREPDHPWDADAARAAGIELLRRGAVAAFTPAGGQGTRLGWRSPKGTYPATVVAGKPLFRCLAEQLLATQQRFGVVVPWYIMTSVENDATTRAFFLDNNCFGLPRSSLFLFPQSMLPAVDADTGRVLLAERDALALGPDGHGGALGALRESGALADLQARGIEHLCAFQVDNPLVRAIDPVFLGLHVGAPGSSGEMSSKMVVKERSDEKVGVFCTSGGRTRVVEYSDLPADLAAARDDAGRLRFRAGSIAVHVIATAFVERLTADAGDDLPWHRALKRVPYVDPATGERVEPEAPNALRFEKFIFDAIPAARSSLVLETDRAEEFAPIKNRTGHDSPATSYRAQSERAARWLEAHDVAVARDAEGAVAARIEISPLTALEAADLAALDLPPRIDAGAEIVL